MSITPKSIHEIIQTVSERLDSSQGMLDVKTVEIARKALDELSNRELTAPSDKMEFIVLASRFFVLSQTRKTEIDTSLISRLFDLFGCMCGKERTAFTSQNSKNSALVQGFLSKVDLTEESAKQVEEILSKLPKARECILRESASQIKDSSTVEQCILILQEAQEKKWGALMESIKILAKKNPSKVVSVIKDNAITAQGALIEIAKIAAAQNRDEISYYHIKDYGITDERALIEIAKIVAARSGDEVSYHIKEYDITDERALIEIAKIAAARSGWIVSQHIQNYGITDQKALVEIAKMAMKRRAGISEYIKNFGITDQAVLIEIAKMEAMQDGEGVSRHIEDYGITDQAALIEIAKIAAAQDGEGVSLFIEDYGITDQGALIEIAKIAAAQNGESVSEYIKNFGIMDQGARLEIAKIASQKNLFSTFYYINNFDLDKSTDEYKDFMVRGWLFGFATGNKEIVEEITRIPCAASFLFGNDDTSAISDDKTAPKKKALTPFAACIQVGAKQILPENLWSEGDRKALLEKVASYRNESIAIELATTLLEGSSLIGFKEALNSLTCKKTKESLTVHKILPSIIPAKWIALAKKERALTLEEETFVENLVFFLDLSRKEFRNNFSPALQSFLQTTIALDKTNDLSSIKKLQILSAVCNSKEFMKGLGLVRSLCSRKEATALKNISLHNPIEELKNAFKAALTRDRFIDLSNIDNLPDKYSDAFENTRIPAALETYIAGIRKLSDESVRRSLERFIRSVLLGTFAVERYDATRNPHLQQIQNYDTDNKTEILEDWKALTFTASVSSIELALEEKNFSFENFFKQKLGDGHGQKNGVETSPELIEFLGADEESRKTILMTMEQKIKEDEKNKIDLVQKLCMELVADQKLSKADKILKLRSICSSLPEVELKNDLSGLVQNLENPQKSSLKEKVELCSGWNDLFLAGSEVAGSCQRVDGQASLNKCLLAYCLDGKNAMVAVKGEDKKICARSMLRLLWDNGEAKPVLFLDRLYPDPCPKEREEAIKMAACKCAEKLRIELYTDWGSGSPSQGKTIESLGSSCPYEYADGAEGVTNGVFTIKGARKME